jgi:hypothetical protein
MLGSMVVLMSLIRLNYVHSSSRMSNLPVWCVLFTLGDISLEE